MKLPKQHGRPGPYTFKQHQGIMSLNKSLDHRDDYEVHTCGIQLAQQHLLQVKNLCSEHGKFMVEFGPILTLASWIMLAEKASELFQQLRFLLSLIIPRNHQALSFYKQVRDRHYIISYDNPWDEQLMCKWGAMIREIEIEFEAQLEATIDARKWALHHISLCKQELSIVLNADILQWSL
jgi:hypothetical protein